jgi:cysteine desulfurase family protein (TIGR01976 family)
MTIDVARVRGLYPTLGSGLAQLEGPFGALQPETVIRAIISALRTAPAQPGSWSTRSRRGAASLQAARAAVADLVGGHASSVVFGANQSTLMMQFVARLSADWLLGDDIVVSRLDHDGDLNQLLLAARSAGVIVKWAEVDVESGELPDWQYDRLITPHTRIVTVPLVDPTTGTVPDVRAIADRAHAAGALVIVNAGAALPYQPVDMTAIGADLISVAMDSFGGPTIAAIVARPGLLTELGDSPAARAEQFELGPLPVELLDGVVAAIDHLANLDESASGPRRQRLTTSLTEVGRSQRRVYAHLDSQLRAIPAVTVLGSVAERAPLAAFTVKGYSPDRVADHLARHGVSVWTGSTGQSQLMRAMGADELGGPVRIGIMPHTIRAEVDQLAAALGKLVNDADADPGQVWHYEEPRTFAAQPRRGPTRAR